MQSRGKRASKADGRVIIIAVRSTVRTGTYVRMCTCIGCGMDGEPAFPNKGRVVQSSDVSAPKGCVCEKMPPLHSLLIFVVAEV